MASFQNTQEISMIIMQKKLHNFCTIGQDWYTNDIEIFVKPSDTIPDYIEIDNELNSLEGTERIIEDVVYAIVEMLKKYKPLYIRVASKVEDATHLAVTVEKEWRAHE